VTGNVGGGTTGGGSPDRSRRVYAPDFVTELFRNPLDPGYAEAAARRKARGGESAATRAGGFSARTIVLVAAGFLLAIAYHQTVAAHPQANQIRTNLVNDVKARQAETDAMQKRADDLRDQEEVEEQWYAQQPGEADQVRYGPDPAPRLCCVAHLRHDLPRPIR